MLFSETDDGEESFGNFNDAFETLFISGFDAVEKEFFDELDKVNEAYG